MDYTMPIGSKSPSNGFYIVNIKPGFAITTTKKLEAESQKLASRQRIQSAQSEQLRH